MPTIKSVCDTLMEKLCREQNFVAGACVRDVKRAVDPKGTKELNKAGVKKTRAFLALVVKTAYH